MRVNIKKTAMIVLLYIALIGLMYNIPTTFLSDIIYNFQKEINEWDVLHILLGYYQTIPQQSITYLDIKDYMQTFIPMCVQLIGILFSVQFLAIPLSFHQFIKTRAKNRWHYYAVFIKNIWQGALIYPIILYFSLLTILKTTNIISSTSSFNYQSGNYLVALLFYSCILSLAIICFSLFIFIGYINNKGTTFILLSVVSLLVLNILDKVTDSFNFILFDYSHYFIDSFLFWVIILAIESFILKKISLTQEVFHD